MLYTWCIKENATYMRKLRNFENKNANYEILYSSKLVRRSN